MSRISRKNTAALKNTLSKPEESNVDTVMEQEPEEPALNFAESSKSEENIARVVFEANATADQTAAEIRALVESASDSNVFTDALKTKLDGAGTQSVVTTAPTSASGFANGHVWYVV